MNSRILIAFTIGLLPLSAARAELVTFAYRGQVDTVFSGGASPGPYLPYLGETFQVVYTFETDTPADFEAGRDSRPGFGFIGQYVGAIKGVSVTVGPPDSPLGHFTSDSPFSSIGVGSPNPYFVFIQDLGPVQTGKDFPENLPILAFLIGFNHPGPPVGPGLLPRVPDPSLFSSVRMQFDFAETEFSPIVSLRANALRVVPEPGTMSLLGFSALVLAERSRRRRRRHLVSGRD